MFLLLSKLASDEMALPNRQHLSSDPTAVSMSARRLPSWLIEEYLAVLFGSEDMDPEVRQRAAIEHHAELNFRLNGGGKCAICRSHVRHVVEVTVRKGRDTE